MTIAPDTPVFLLTPTTQQYDWGKLGNSSKVAQLASAAQLPGFVLLEDTPYAEVAIHFLSRMLCPR
jgi:mannose-6-phosphate isomerase